MSGCIETRLVDLDHLNVPLPPAEPRARWHHELSALLARYESAPVLAPKDARFEPLLGGLATLSYFGADAEARARDQRIASDERQRGLPLPAACAQSPAAPPIGADLPAFAPAWVPLAIAGGAAAQAVQCDDTGTPRGPGADASFCMFARVALQPGTRHPLAIVVHGLFDSGAQYYVQRTAAELYQLGMSVILPDMRDHGATLRAAPGIATALGTLEGDDLLALAELARQGCGERVERIGIAGVSGGGLDAIRAFARDRTGLLDAGVLALSPLLDIDEAIADLSRTGACPLTRSIELTWFDDALVGVAGGATFFAGSALGAALDQRRLGSDTAIAAGIGAAAGLLTGAAIDAFFDGGSEPCVSQNAIAQLVQGALRLRWRALRAPAYARYISPEGRRIEPSAVTLEDYLVERVQYLAQRQHLSWRRFDPRELAAELHAKPRGDARLFVLGADDDPMTRRAALHDFIARTRDLPEVYAHAVRHGGHGAMSLVQPSVMRRVFARFFELAD
jgi:hypothetical protein